MAPETATGTVKATQPPTEAVKPKAQRERLPLGPLENIHVYWLAGMSCDGCTIAVAGATNPGIEGLLLGTVPAMPKMLLHHPVLSVEAGAEFVQSFHNAWNGKLESIKVNGPVDDAKFQKPKEAEGDEEEAEETPVPKKGQPEQRIPKAPAKQKEAR